MQRVDDRIPQNQSTLLGARLIGLALLLVGELLVLTIRFDAADAVRSSQWIRIVTDHVSTVPKMLAVIFTATLIFGGTQLSEAWGAFSYRIAEFRNWGRWLAFHLGCFIVFGLVTSYVLEVNQNAAGIWYVCWLISGVACGASWCVSAVHPSVWKEAARCLIGPVFAGTVIGFCGWIGGQ